MLQKILVNSVFSLFLFGTSMLFANNTNISSQNGVVTSQQSLDISKNTFAIFQDMIDKEQTRIAVKKTKIFLNINNEFLIDKLNKLIELYINSQITYNKQMLLGKQIQTVRETKNDKK